MSVTGGPYRPKDGWQWRWPLQAAGLLVRSPAAILTCLAGLLGVGLLQGVLLGLPVGPWGGAIVLSALTSLGGLVIVATSAMLAIDEGYGLADRADLVAAARTYAVGTFLIQSVFLVVAIALLFAGLDMTAGMALPHREGSGLILSSGTGPVVSALFAAILVNPLWPSLVTQKPMRLAELRFSGLMVMRTCFQAWLAILAVMLLAGFATLVLPAPASAALVIFLAAWLYVATREIYGGISGNRHSETAQTPLAEA